ncbi:hypothetical protein T459_32276 [Capsicum annuum]|uniref:Uncharacterized protein n=1 Tax=Capsicum annuum TaxID=4072 RepID=A0A2G2Y268_CAPAN|nr:hypothetical protein FXO37_05087 [Capsicum annuum]PHT63856.1 hypothetical protein T459_32276 [Capsicum annuum]
MLVGTDDWLNGCCSSDPRSLDFPCSSSRILCLKEDILDMEDAARHFELDKVVLHEVQQQSRKNDDFSLLLNMFPRAEDDGYVPYCEINFDWADDSVEQTTYEETPNASAPVASDLDYSNTQVLKFFQVNSGSMAFLLQWHPRTNQCHSRLIYHLPHLFIQEFKFLIFFQVF